MTTVRLICVGCGDIALPPDRVRLITWTRTRGLAHFRCCDEDQLAPVNAGQIEALRRGGVVVVEMPSQPVMDGPPLSLDDLIDLHISLEEA